MFQNAKKLKSYHNSHFLFRFASAVSRQIFTLDHLIHKRAEIISVHERCFEIPKDVTLRFVVDWLQKLKNMSGVRQRQKDIRSNETRKRKVAQWKAQAVDNGKRDSKRISTLSVEQLHFLYDRASDFVKVEDCHISSGDRASSGYPRGISLECFTEKSAWNNSEFHLSLLFPRSHIILAAHGKIAQSSSDDASHLCNNRMCINPDHLCWESRIKNLSRVNCPISIMCECCSNVTNACVHIPKCIKQK